MDSPARRYNPPPNWPAPPLGWTPPAGWEPDPAWGPPPPGWQLWGEPAGGSGRRTAVLAAVLLVALLLVIGACLFVGALLLVRSSGGTTPGSAVRAFPSASASASVSTSADVPVLPGGPSASTEPDQPTEPTTPALVAPQKIPALSAADRAVCAGVGAEIGSMGRVLIGIGSGSTTTAEAGAALKKAADRMTAELPRAASPPLRASLTSGAAALLGLRAAFLSGETTQLQAQSVAVTTKLREFQHACVG